MAECDRGPGQQFAGYRRAFSAGLFRLRDRRFGQRQIDTGQRYPARCTGPRSLPREGNSGCAPGDSRCRAGAPYGRGRPVADRANTAVESRDLHGRVRSDPRNVFPSARGAGARLRCREVQFQCEGRTLRALPGRWRAQGRDAFPGRCFRDLRRLQRTALQSRNAGNHLQGKEHRRYPRHDGGRGSLVFPRRPGRLGEAGHHAGGRARLPHPRPTGQHALRRRSAAD